jgi:hypothetical protein
MYSVLHICIRCQRMDTDAHFLYHVLVPMHVSNTYTMLTRSSPRSLGRTSGDTRIQNTVSGQHVQDSALGGSLPVNNSNEMS